MTFGSPWFLLALLFVPAFVAAAWLAERRRMRYAVKFPNVDVLATVATERTWLRFVPTAVFVLGLAALLVAVARPSVARMVLQERATVILVVDTSRSMQAEDVPPSRLVAEQQAIHTFLDRAPSKLRVGLIIFAGEAQVATPPTRDKDLVRTAVDQANSFLVYGGTAIGDALQTAVELGRSATEDAPSGGSVALGGVRRGTRSLAQSTPPASSRSPVSILFMSDGSQTRGVLQPLEGAARARDAGIPVYTIALGTPGGVIKRGGFGGPGGAFPGDSTVIPVPPDPDTLRRIAELTGGQFSEARTAEALQKAYANLGSRLGRVPGHTEVTFAFVAAGALLLLVAGALGALLSPRLP